MSMSKGLRGTTVHPVFVRSYSLDSATAYDYEMRNDVSGLIGYIKVMGVIW